MSSSMRFFLLFLSMLCLGASRPNILWLSTEDISPHLGCYGAPHATTPNLDRLASQGLRYANAFTVTGVCATCRNSMITCMYPSTLGTQFMRCRVDLPDHVELFPQYFRDAGYYCTNNSKTDYNITGSHKRCWDESSRSAHWKNRPDTDQPFFAVFNFTNTHESRVFNYRPPQNLDESQLHDPDNMEVPPYYPDNEVTRADWAHYYDNITSMDLRAGQLLDELKEAGLADNTIVVFWSDHGVGLPRAKRWIYESGTHVPLIIRIPEAYQDESVGAAGSVREELVSLMDLPATMMNLAGIEIPDYFHGQPFLGPNRASPRQYIHTIRDRMDERYDMIRAVRDDRYKYIRNYQPYRPWFQRINYMEQEHTMQELRRLHAAGKLHPEAAQFMADHKPLEELYDLENDAHEVNNLIDQAASDPKLAQVLERLRAQHHDWIFATRDTGLIPEAELALRAKQVGTRYAILRQPGWDHLLRRLLATNRAACGDASQLDFLIKASRDEDAAVRFWALTGIANLADNDPQSVAATAARKTIDRGLKDTSGSVRVAAARAAWLIGHTDQATAALREAANSGQEFLALAAMHVIDEMGADARALRDVVAKFQENNFGYPSRIASIIEFE